MRSGPVLRTSHAHGLGRIMCLAVGVAVLGLALAGCQDDCPDAAERVEMRVDRQLRYSHELVLEYLLERPEEYEQMLAEVEGEPRRELEHTTEQLLDVLDTGTDPDQVDVDDPELRQALLDHRRALLDTAPEHRMRAIFVREPNERADQDYVRALHEAGCR